MKIASDAIAFDKDDEYFKALKQLTFYAKTREEAEFLSKLHACIRFGNPDIALKELIERLQR